MIKDGRADFQRMRHAGSVNLHQDVVSEIGFYVNVLDARQRVIRICSMIVVTKHIQGIITVEFDYEILMQDFSLQFRLKSRNGAKVSFDGSTGQVLKCCFASKDARSPIGLG